MRGVWFFVDTWGGRLRFGGRANGLHQQAKGAAHYGLTEDRIRWAWEQYQRGVRAHTIVGSLKRRGKSQRPISIRKLVVEWGAMGYPVWEFGRRTRMRDETGRLLERLQDRFDTTQPCVMYAARDRRINDPFLPRDKG